MLIVSRFAPLQNPIFECAPRGLIKDVVGPVRYKCPWAKFVTHRSHRIFDQTISLDLIGEEYTQKQDFETVQTVKR